MKTTTTRLHSLGRIIGSTAVLLLSLLKPAFSQAQAGSVVISEVYAGGSATAAFKNDFVELYNKSNTAFSLTGYSLQYRGTGTTTNYARVLLTGLTIPANGYLLVQYAGAATGNPLPAPDATGTSNLSTTGGKVALVNGTAALPGTSTATDAGIIDFVGYGTVDRSEGNSPAPTSTATLSIERKALALSTSASMAAGGADALLGNGHDSQNNAQDFVVRTGPAPQNSASAPEAAATAFYSTKVLGGPLNDLATYSSTLDGTGPSPTSFSSDFQLFYVIGAGRTLTGDLTVTGAGSRLILETASSVVVPADFDYTGTLDLGSNATLTELNPEPGVVLNNIAASSTVEFAQATAFNVPIFGTAYGNLTLRNATKLLSAGTTGVRGNFLADNVSDALGGAAGSASTLSLGGNFTLTGTVNFSTVGDAQIALILTNTQTPQVIEGNGNLIKLYKLTLPTGQAGASLAGSSSSLELGNGLPGGGYALATNTTFTLNSNTLSFAANGRATIGTGNGVLALSPATNLVFRKNGPASLGTLRLSAGSTQLNNFTLDAAGTNNTLTLPASLTVNGTLNLTAGNLTIGTASLLTLNGPVVVGSGTLSGVGAGTSSLAIGGTGALSTLTINSGLSSFTLNRPGAFLTLGDDLTVNSALNLVDGVLGIGSNTLTLNGTVSTTPTGLLSGSFSSDLRIGGTGPLGTIRFEATTGVLDDLILNRPSGTLSVVGTTLQVAKPTLTSGVLSLGSNVSLNVSGVLTVADPAVAQFAGTTSSSLNFTGAGAIGPLAFVAGQDRIQGLTLARTSGAIPTVQLVTSLTVENLTLTTGRIFVQGNNKLEVLPEGSLVGGGPNSFSNTLTLATITNSTTSKVSLTFPLGVNLQYRPLTLNVKDRVVGTTSYTARQFEAPSPSRTLPPTLARVSQIRYYNVVPDGGGTSILDSASVRLTYNDVRDGVTPANISFLRVAMADPTDNSKWRDAGISNVTGNDITSDIFPAGPLGDFTLATDINTPPNTNPLPVELVRFGAERQGAAGVRVEWATASEKNSARFEVERSLDGFRFVTVARVLAQGNSSQLHAYSALDAQAPAGRLYYRLRQVDVDGTVAFSEVVTVNGITGPAGELSVYPNPTSERLTAALPAAEGRTYRVLNGLGKVLDQGRAAGANPSVNVRHLPAGTYFLELNSATGRQVRRFVKYD